MQKTCLHCGKPFQAQRTTAKYCSTECRVSYHRAVKREAERQREIDAQMKNTFDNLRYQIKRYCDYAERVKRTEQLIGYLESLEDIIHTEMAYQVTAGRDRYATEDS